MKKRICLKAYTFKCFSLYFISESDIIVFVMTIYVKSVADSFVILMTVVCCLVFNCGIVFVTRLMVKWRPNVAFCRPRVEILGYYVAVVCLAADGHMQICYMFHDNNSLHVRFAYPHISKYIY